MGLKILATNAQQGMEIYVGTIKNNAKNSCHEAFALFLVIGIALVILQHFQKNSLFLWYSKLTPATNHYFWVIEKGSMTNTYYNANLLKFKICVLNFMSIQTTFLSKSCIANVTFERFISFINCWYMSIQAPTLHKPCITNTVKWL